MEVCARPNHREVYTSANFLRSDEQQAMQLMAAHPLAAVIAVDGTDGLPYAAHVPLLFDNERRVLVGHFSYSNPHWRRCQQVKNVLVVFRGTDSYISPSWYPEKKAHGKVVPTWNYEAIHVRGSFHMLSNPDDPKYNSAAVDPETLNVVTKLTDANERALTAAAERRRDQPAAVAWKVADAPRGYVKALIGEIVAFEICVTSLTMAFKQSQNKTRETQDGVRAGLRSVHRALEAEAIGGTRLASRL